MLQNFKEVKDARKQDPQAFYQLVVIARSIAVTRPHQNLWQIHADDQEYGGEELNGAFVGVGTADHGRYAAVAQGEAKESLAHVHMLVE